jgi:hypothetical protein
MRHATDPALDALEPFLRELRALRGLTEKKRGIFYLRSQALLHFHEDPAGFFADVRVGRDWVRFPAGSARQRRAILAAVRGELAALPAARERAGTPEALTPRRRG